jgi:Tat protein secretion system quality control protein TatD with DNase activity
MQTGFFTAQVYRAQRMNLDIYLPQRRGDAEVIYVARSPDEVKRNPGIFHSFKQPSISLRFILATIL